MPRGVPHPPDVVLRAVALREAGLSIVSIARDCGLPQGTVSRWCRGLLPANAAMQRAGANPVRRCRRCGDLPHDDLPAGAYAYLLGIYLGDGCLGCGDRSIPLRVVMDVAYPAIIDEVSTAMLAVRPDGSVSRYRPRDERCIVLTCCSRAWRCLLPQHGAGRKHDRPIVLEPWQLAIVREHPGRFARGLIHSDGWRGTNRVRVKGRDYAYPRYQFSNRSDDIRRLFTDALDELGVAWRPWGRFHISVARRDAVALLDEHVGPKA